MATRAHLREQITSDKIGALAPVPYATVSVYETGTTTPVAATMYQTATGVGVYSNPLTADANGVIEFWMTNAQVVDLAISASGYNAATVTAQVIGTDTATGILNLNTTTTPASAGDVQIATDDFTWEGAGGLKTAVRLDGTQTVTGAKTATALTVADATDHTKTLGWDLSGATTGTKTTVKASQTAARTITLPDATDTLVGKATTDTLTNKTLTSPTITTPTLNGSGGALTLPAGPDTLVGRATTDTLTNKTLTSPTVTGASADQTIYTDAAAPAAPGAGKTAIYSVSGTPHFRAGSGGADTPLSIYKELGKATQISNQAITSTATPGTDMTGLTVTCTPDGVHDVKVSVTVPYPYQSTSGAGWYLAIQKDGVVMTVRRVPAATSSSAPVPASLWWVDVAPTNASHTYKVSAWADTAATTLNTNNTTTSVNYLLVEQIG